MEYENRFGMHYLQDRPLPASGRWARLSLRLQANIFSFSESALSALPLSRLQSALSEVRQTAGNLGSSKWHCWLSQVATDAENEVSSVRPARLPA